MRGRRLGLLGLYATIALMAIPAAALGAPVGLSGSSAVAPSAAHSLPYAPLALPAPAAASHPATAGIDTSTNVPINGPALEESYLAKFAAAGVDPTGKGPIANLVPTPSGTSGAAASSYVGASTPSTLTSAQTPASPAPAASTIATGTVFGYVFQWRTGVPLQGVTVQAYSSGGAICPDYLCSQTSTTSNGSYTVTAPVGNSYIQFQLGWNLTNVTYVTVYNGLTTYAPPVYLVPDGIGYGYVYGNTTSTPKLQNVAVCATSRDQLISAAPCATSDSNGYYKIPIPPVPSIVRLTPVAGYEPDFLFTNSTPHFPGDPIVFLGAIYLTHLVRVQVTLYDGVTHSPIPSGACPATCRAIQACSSVTMSCQLQGSAVGGYTMEGFALPGQNVIKVWATGYLTTTVPIGNVSKLDPGQIFNAGKIYLVPLGAASVRVGITTNGSGYTGRWAVSGLWVATVQSMAGYQTGVPTPGSVFNPNLVNMSATGSIQGGCVGIGSGSSTPKTPISVFPGMNDLVVRPDYTPTCSLTPTWPIPYFFPVYSNESYVNGTPDEQVTTLSGGPGAQADWLNLTAGTYIYGHVGITGVKNGFVRNYTVTVTSTDSGAYTPYPFTWACVFSGSTCSEENNGWACSGSTANDQSFCVPAPPGNSKITISAVGYPTNGTWVYTHRICCNSTIETKGMPLAAVTLEHTSWINFTQQGSVYGGVYREGTNLGVSFGTITACSAGTSVLIPGLGCGSGVVLNNGSFSSTAPLGWDYIEATASGFEGNPVWAYVNRTNVFVGNITLTQVATIDGRVVDPLGNPLLEAQVKTCLLQTANACNVLGIGQTTSDGYYNGTIAGGWLPYATYEVTASAPGYTTDWTFVNATSGMTTTAPTITLRPVGTTGGLPLASAAPAGVWVYGRLIDSSTGYGIPGASITACSLAGGTCTVFVYGSNSLGDFNDSVLPGLYLLNINVAGYLPVSFEFNATANPFLNLGDILLKPVDWISGNLDLNPWFNISIKTGSGTVLLPLGPSATAQACNTGRTFCGIGIPVATYGGNFTIASPIGQYNQVQGIPLGTGVGPSAPGGYTQNSSTYNSSGYYTTLNSTINLDVFTSVAGFVMDASTVNPETAESPWLPAAYQSISIISTGPKHATAVGQTNGGGFYDFFLPPGPSSASIDLLASTEYANANTTISALFLPAGSLWANDSNHPNMTAERFGYVAFYVLDSVTNAGVGYVGGSTIWTDYKTGATYSFSAAANGAGLVNVTSMFGDGVLVSVGGTQDTNSTKFYVGVNSTKTTYAGVLDPTFVAPPFQAELLDPWGWIQSTQLNNSTGSPISTVFDQAKHLPLPGVVISTSSSDPQYGTGGTPSTNYQGQFLADAPVGAADSLTATRYAYLINTTKLNVEPGAQIVKPWLNLTGDAVVAGRVVGLPGDVPLQGATVSLCAPKGSCSSAVTNSTGVFWVLATPGVTDTVTATADGYVTNDTAATPVQPHSDQWVWMGKIELNQYAFVSGIVRALPSGLTVSGANVDLCAPTGSPTGPCGFTNVTGTTGTFLVEAPAGTYILAANATNFNATYRPLALSPGQHASMGTIFLEQFGTLQGFVYSQTTLAPVPKALVYACARWGGGSCTPAVSTDSTGSFFTSGPPGPFELTVSAPGFDDGYVATTISSGATTALPPIFLTPLGTDVSYPVAGSVVNASNPAQGVGGAVLSLSIGTAKSFSTVALASGVFAFQATYGTYTLTVTAGGFRPLVRSLVVTGPIAGLTLALGIMTYNVTGVATDGLNGQPLAAVNLVDVTGGGSVPLASSGLDGGFQFAVPNGTHFIQASYGGALAIPYGTISFAIAMNGAPQTHDLTLYPSGVLVHGVVVNAQTGLPLALAPVTIAGTAADGAPISMQVIAGVDGNFSLNLPTGTYAANTTYDGFVANQVSFDVAPPGAPVTLALQPTHVAVSSSGGVSPVVWVLGAMGLVVVVGIGALLVLRRRRAPPTAPAKAAPTGPKAPRAGGRP